MKHSRGNTGTLRRVIKQASIFLLLGTIVNVAVAWGYSWLQTRSVGKTFPIFPDDEDFDGAISDLWKKYFPSDMNQESLSPWLCYTYDDGVLQWDKLIAHDESTHVLDATFVKAGYPMNCLSYHYWTRQYNGGEVEYYNFRFALLSKQPLPSKKNYVRIAALPLRPLWSGFAINTIFYGVILWLLLFMPFVIRRWRRNRRGLCMKCGYNLRGDFESGCSECGWGREA